MEIIEREQTKHNEAELRQNLIAHNFTFILSQSSFRQPCIDYKNQQSPSQHMAQQRSIINQHDKRSVQNVKYCVDSTNKERKRRSIKKTKKG